MKKLVSNVLVVSAQLIVGILFLCVLFSDGNGDNKVVVVDNDNLNKMADSVSVLFRKNNNYLKLSLNDTEEIELSSSEVETTKEEVVEEVNEVVEEVSEPQILMSVDPSGYLSDEEHGFVVTTDNKTYTLSSDEFDALAGVVACEAKEDSKDDILAVMSVILNRAEYHGISPVSEIAAGGFECYGMERTPNDLIVSVIKDSLNGLRNNSYTGFRSWARVNYSDNYITVNGNRYGNW